MLGDDEITEKNKSQVVVGSDLSTISVDELGKRITLFESEIARIKTEIEKKQSSKTSAESFFRK